MISVKEAPEDALNEAEELRAQYVACSYLATACQDALGRFRALVSVQGGRVASRALELLLAVEWDWRQTLQELAGKVSEASTAGARYNPGHAEDTDTAGEGAASHRADQRARTPVHRRL